MNELKEKMKQCMAIPYGFKKIADGNAQMEAAEIFVAFAIGTDKTLLLGYTNK